MKLDDLKNDWQETVVDAPSEDLSEVITMLAKQTTQIDKEIKRRDILEISIALCLIPLWIYALLNSAGIMQTTGLIIAIISCLYIPYRLIKAKKVAPPKNSDIKSYLTTEKQKIYQQKKLLESVATWYIAPIAASIVLITLGATVNASGVPQLSYHLTVYYGFLLLLIVAIYALNKRAARKKFGPLLTQIEQRLSELNSQ